MSEIVISLKDVSKCYKRYARPVDRLKELILPNKDLSKEFWALQDIDLEILQGETVGIVGQNGSGKSTLLQIITGTLTPTKGQVNVHKRVSALLELGSGFNPEFTGEQNIFFNGQILGLSREEIENKYNDIVSFAEIGDFISQPVKTYSSGMVVRLAFAVIANLEPQILIVDEALAVGDAKFQSRCMKRIRQLKDQGVTILFVSHDSSSVKMLCQRAVLMDKGRILETGTPNTIINHYIALLSSSERDDTNLEEVILNKENNDVIEKSILDGKTIYSVNNEAPLISDSEKHRHGNGLAIIKDAKLIDCHNRESTKLKTGKNFNLVAYIETLTNIDDLVVGISIRNLMGVVIYGTNTFLLNSQLIAIEASSLLKVNFQIPCYFNKGVYTVTLGLHSEEGVSYDWIDELIVFEVTNTNQCDGILDLKSTVEIQKEFYIRA